MKDFATPNLPSRDFDATETFYALLGFSRRHRSGHWMILTRGEAWLEFFPWADLAPDKNNASCCIRLDELAPLVEQCYDAGIPRGREAIPRIVPPARDVSGLTIAYLVDGDGSLLRLIQKPDRPADP